MAESKEINEIQKAAKEAGCHLEEKQAAQLLSYLRLLQEKNKVMNLTAVDDFEGILQTHFADSLSLVRAVNISEACSLIDIGTGAGFPGLPLAIAFPQLRVTLLDSLQKRVGFLEEVIAALELANVRTVQGRAEDGARLPEYREKFDLVVSRAVAHLSVLAEYCLPYVKVGGKFVAYKSAQAEEEISGAQAAVKKLGGRMTEEKPFSLFDKGRMLVVIEKTAATPKEYPRRAGVPAKKPL